MAVISSHVLDAVKGISAVGIRIELFRLYDANPSQRLFETHSDSEGRISESVAVVGNPADAVYELVFHTGDYFPVTVISEESRHNVQSVVVRISMPDPDARYHIPVVLSPHSYTVWWSG